MGCLYIFLGGNAFNSITVNNIDNYYLFISEWILVIIGLCYLLVFFLSQNKLFTIILPKPITLQKCCNKTYMYSKPKDLEDIGSPKMDPELGNTVATNPPIIGL